MADAGKDPIPEFKESIKISKKFKNVEIFGQALESHIIIFKPNKLDVI